MKLGQVQGQGVSLEYLGDYTKPLKGPVISGVEIPKSLHNDSL